MTEYAEGRRNADHEFGHGVLSVSVVRERAWFYIDECASCGYVEGHDDDMRGFMGRVWELAGPPLERVAANHC